MIGTEAPQQPPREPDGLAGRAHAAAFRRLRSGPAHWGDHAIGIARIPRNRRVCAVAIPAFRE
jgi:hypothetical protein